MSDGVWVSVMGLAALAAVIWLIVRDTATSPEVKAVHETAEASMPHAATRSPTPPSTGDNWRGAGWLIMLGGAVGLGVALFMDTSVETYAPAILGGGTREVINLDLLFSKGVAIACSLTSICTGLFCLAVGSIIGAIAARQS